VHLHEFGSDGGEGVVDIHGEAVAKQRVAAFFVNGLALDVHHVVVFEQAFADTEVVFLYFFLCAFDGLFVTILSAG
jgi:hypothetical protein